MFQLHGFAREGKIYDRKIETTKSVLEEIAMSCKPGIVGNSYAKVRPER